MAPWLLLIAAGLLESVWAIGLKYTEGFTRFWPSVGTIAAMLVSFVLLAKAMQSLPLGLAYTVWVGIGAVGALVGGAAIFGERMAPAQYLFVLLIVGGIVGLKMAQPSAAAASATAASPETAPPPRASPTAPPR